MPALCAGFTHGLNQIARRACVAAFALCAMLAMTSHPVQAQDAASSFPSRPIRIIVPFAAGGASDVLARILGKRLAEVWGQPVVVENKTGGNAQIGAALVAKSEPDGYTLLVVDLSAMTMTPAMMGNLTYNPERDLTPVSILAYSPHILVVANRLPVKTFDEFLAYARSQKEPVSFGSPLGAAPHLAGVLLSKKEGIEFNFIGYKGGAQVLSDLAGGQIDVTMNSYLATYPMARNGSYRLIAVASPGRFAPIPDTPAIAERIPGFVTGSFQGMMAPSATPPAIIDKLNKTLAQIIQEPAIQRQYADLGSIPVEKSPAELREWIAGETRYWRTVIDEGKIRID